MVQTYQSPVRIYKFPFELVMAAYQKRFPTCPEIPIFVGSEITVDDWSEDKTQHVIERKCQLDVEAPYLLKKIASCDYIYFVQRNEYDWRGRKMQISAYNLSFDNRVVVQENCIYYVHPENDKWTCFEQSASLDVKSFFGFETTVEKIAVKHYAANIEKGREVLEKHINLVVEDGFENTEIYRLVTSFEEVLDNFVDATETRKISEKSDSPQPSSEEEDDQATLRRASLPMHSARGDSQKNTARSGTLPQSSSQHKDLTPQLSGEDGGLKLETEYIRRFLGNLSMIEESRLCELRYWMNHTHKGKAPNDAHLLRFLRARDFDIAKAREMLLQSIRWRKQHKVDRILSTYKPPEVLQQYFAGAWHEYDLTGRPLYVFRLGCLDIKGLLKAVGEDELTKFVLALCEDGLQKTEEATVKFGKPISSWTMLVDLEGLNMRHLWRPGLKALVKIIEIVEANYPETMGLALIVRAPRVFPVVFTLIAPFIHENTRKKFMIYGGEDYAGTGGLCDYISKKNVPDFLGGRAYCGVPAGGAVPKSLYHYNLEHSASVGVDSTDGGSDQVLASLYQKGHVHKALPHEVLLAVHDVGAVITWDYDIARGECDFQLFRTPKRIDELQLTSHVSGGPPILSPSGIVAAAIGSSTSAPIVATDRSLRLGEDVFAEQHPLRCREGDSVQGSHRAQKAGTYILQWRAFEHEPPANNPGGSAFDFTLPTAVKAKVMYCHEILHSADVSGSMLSLQSSKSSFSSLSLTTLSGGVTPTLARLRSRDPDQPESSKARLFSVGGS